jgi:hypothetical protein
METPERDACASLRAVLIALDASPVSLKRDSIRGEGRTGDLAIYGRRGHIYPDGDGYLLCVVASEHDQSARRWNNVKARLGFCQLRQDGDAEGTLFLSRIPTPHEAGLLREALGIKRKRQLSAEAKVSLARRFSQNLTRRPSDGRLFV